MRRTVSALALSFATHTVAVLAVATTLPVMSRDALIVELNPLVNDQRGATGGEPAAAGPSRRSRPAPSASRTLAQRASPAAARPLLEPPLPRPPAPSPRSDAAPPPHLDVAPPPPVDVTPGPTVDAPIVAVPSGVVASTDTKSSASSAPVPAAAGAATEDDGSLEGRADGVRGNPGGLGSDPTVASLARGTAGDGGQSGYGTYLALLRRRIQDALEYPIVARRRGITGTVHVEIAVQASGAIAEVTVIGSSRHRLLDDAAVDAVRALGHVPFPPGIEPRRLRARLPIVFELQ